MCRAQQQQRPLLGPKQPLSDLLPDYEDGSQVFVSKIKSLQNSYASLRRTRQDGNCFYRSFWFGLLEALILRRDNTETERLVKCLEGWKDKLISVGFQELVFEDALDLVVTLLKSINAPGVSCSPHLHTHTHTHTFVCVFTKTGGKHTFVYCVS